MPLQEASMLRKKKRTSFELFVPLMKKQQIALGRATVAYNSSSSETVRGHHLFHCIAASRPREKVCVCVGWSGWRSFTLQQYCVSHHHLHLRRHEVNYHLSSNPEAQTHHHPNYTQRGKSYKNTKSEETPPGESYFVPNTTLTRLIQPTIPSCTPPPLPPFFSPRQPGEICKTNQYRSRINNR